MKILQTMKLSHLLLLAAFAATSLACSSPAPGYRHEGQGPDQRLLDLVERYHVLQDPSRPRDRAEEQLLVDGQRVLNELRRLHNDYPGHVATLYTLASVTYDQGGRERASGYLDALFAIQAAHPEAGVLRSRIAIDEGNLPAAKRVLERQLRFRPDHAGLWEASSAAAYLDHDLTGAREALEMALRLGAPEWRVAFNQGLIEEADENPSEARKRYEAALSENPEYQPAASRLAGLRAAGGEKVR